PYVLVDDCNFTANKAKELGGKILVPPTNIPNVGDFSVFADPTGAVLSLWTANEGDMPDAERVPAGAWCWIELMTRDEAAAIAFYTGLIGYDDQPVPGSEPPYHLLANDGRPRAGLMRSPDPGLPSFWLPYVMTEDLPATVTAAVAAGATVRKDQTAIPGTGRFAVFGDPTGAVIGAFEPAPRG
ncbi:MAG: VOC family protein, partial [Burkholderiales bacterium]